MRHVALFAAFVCSVRWVAPPPGHAQTPPSEDSLLYAACMPVYVEDLKQRGSDEQRAPVMASMICQMVAGACPPELGGERCDKSIRVLSDKVEKSGLSLPYLAASAGRTDLTKKLIELKVDVNKPIKGGWTPLMIAAAHNGHIEVMRVLLDHRADVSIRDKQGQTALAWAEAQGKVELAQALRDATAKR